MTPNADDATFDWYVGIDCGGATHQVCVLDGEGRRIAERAVAHSGQDLTAFGAWPHEMAGPSLARVAVWLESPQRDRWRCASSRGGGVRHQPEAAHGDRSLPRTDS